MVIGLVAGRRWRAQAGFLVPFAQSDRQASLITLAVTLVAVPLRTALLAALPVAALICSSPDAVIQWAKTRGVSRDTVIGANSVIKSLRDQSFRAAASVNSRCNTTRHFPAVSAYATASVYPVNLMGAGLHHAVTPCRPCSRFYSAAAFPSVQAGAEINAAAGRSYVAR